MQATVPPLAGLGVALTWEVIAVKVAVMFLLVVTLFSVQTFPLVLSQPVKLVNVYPVAGVAVQETLLPDGTGFGGVQTTVPPADGLAVTLTLAHCEALVVVTDG